MAAWFVVLCMFAGAAAQAEPYKPEAGPHPVDTYTEDWYDTERDRTVPVRVYRPLDAEGVRPIVVVSHGLGGTRDALSYLGEHWASHGYVCVHMQHHGSDDAVWRDVPARERMRAMRRATLDAQAAADRLADVPFVLDTLESAQHDEASPLHGRLDLEHIAITGHSYGAWTCMALAGQTRGLRGDVSSRDDRIDVAIPLSCPVPRNERTYERAFAPVCIPVLHLTGSLDESPVSSVTAAQRRVPYDYTPGREDGGAAQYLVTFEGGDHMVLGGPPRDGRRNRVTDRMRERAGVDLERDPVIHDLIRQSTMAFLDGWLLGDDDAIAWLDEEGLEEEVGEDGVVESK
ncbi:MAG: dienelactone hydrolase [Planctomycetota bacterium]